MKSETKKALFFLFLTFAYTLQAIVSMYKFNYIYLFGFMAAVALLYVIKNKYLGAIVGALIFVATEFYNSDYKYLTAIAFLLICAHKNLVCDASSYEKDKKDTDVFSFLLVQLSIFASAALLVYSLILIDRNNINDSAISFSRIYPIFLWLTGMFVCSMSAGRSNKKNALKINKQVSGSLRFMYIVSILGFTATVLYAYAKIGFIHIAYEAVFFPWFVYICSMVYNDDPYITHLAKSIEKLLTDISYKEKVKE